MRVERARSDELVGVFERRLEEQSGTGEVARAVHGGWYLPARVEDNVRSARYACFGAASEGLCPR